MPPVANIRAFEYIRKQFSFVLSQSRYCNADFTQLLVCLPKLRLLFQNSSFPDFKKGFQACNRLPSLRQIPIQAMEIVVEFHAFRSCSLIRSRISKAPRQGAKCMFPTISRHPNSPLYFVMEGTVRQYLDRSTHGCGRLVTYNSGANTIPFGFFSKETNQC